MAKTAARPCAAQQYAQGASSLGVQGMESDPAPWVTT